MVHPGGRPLIFKTVKDLEIAIDKYFDSCWADMPVKDGDETVKMQIKPYTMSGLAFAMGIDRKTLLNYSNKDEYFPTVKKARQKCEVYAEECLFNKNSCPGAIFNLVNNYEQWTNKQETKNTNENTNLNANINREVTDVSTVGDEIVSLMKQLREKKESEE